MNEKDPNLTSVELKRTIKWLDSMLTRFFKNPTPNNNRRLVGVLFTKTQVSCSFKIQLSSLVFAKVKQQNHFHNLATRFCALLSC